MKHSLLLFCFCAAFLVHAKDDYHYTLSWENAHSHTYHIYMKTTPQSGALYTDVKIPAWRPGRYILQNYAAGVFDFEVKNTDGKSLSWKKADKDTWRVDHGTSVGLEITYKFYADNPDAGSSYLGDGQAYFNPVNFFAYVAGRLDAPVTLVVPSLPEDWKIATPLKKSDVYNRFSAVSYHEFVDSPTVFAKRMKQLSFEDQGVAFYLHFQGNYGGDRKVDLALKENVKKICQEQAKIFGGYPFSEYHFIYRLLPFSMRHAVEHSNSASFALPQGVTNSVKALKSMYGLTAHEFWHVWNVKRIRPAALWPYDYSKPQYTGLHWFTEGVTDYFALLTQVRTGLISREYFYRRIANSIGAVENNYAASVVSPTENSLNSWLAYSDYNQPFHRISDYDLGNRIGLIFDLKLREISGGKVGLDEVFQHLYYTYYKQNKGVPEHGIQKAAESLTGTSWQDFFEKYVHGTDPIDYKTFFSPFGLKFTELSDNDTGPRRLGITRLDKASQGLLVQKIHPGGDAWRDGLGRGDLILSIDGKNALEIDTEAYFDELKKGSSVSMQVYSDFEVREIQVRFQGAYTPSVYELEEKGKAGAKAEALRNRWLGQ